MQFNEWLTRLAFGRKQMGRSWKHTPSLKGVEAFYPDQIKLMLRQGQKIDASLLACEAQWHTDRRPYYNVYPGITELLLRIKLDFPVARLAPPIPDLGTILVRLPVSSNPMVFEDRGTSHQLRSALIGFGYSIEKRENILQVWLDIGEFMDNGQPVYTMRNLLVHEDDSVEKAIEGGMRHWSTDVGIQIPIDFQLKAIKLICSLLLLADDDRIIEPDVLTEDQVEYDSTNNRTLVERAVRRGKVGWTVGRHIEMIPHYRRPHMALFWTGRGRTIPKLGLRKGSIVRRPVVGEIPTGYLDDETDSEPKPDSPS